MSNNYITDRIKKLTEALYKVTDLYPDKEPLKWTLRESAIELMLSYMSYRTDKAKGPSFIGQRTVLIIHLLEIASLGGFISDLNFEVLKREYQSLKNFLEEKKDEIFSVPLDLSLIRQPQEHKPPHLSISGGGKGQEILSDKKKRLKTIKNSEEKKQKIINFLKENGKKTIKEIALIFQDIGKKTVQRYLSDLVQTGQLLAEGERRWRVYFLPPSENLDKITQ